MEVCHEGRRQSRGTGLVGLKTRNVSDVMTRLKTGTPAINGRGSRTPLPTVLRDLSYRQGDSAG